MGGSDGGRRERALLVDARARARRQFAARLSHLQLRYETAGLGRPLEIIRPCILAMREFGVVNVECCVG